MLTFYALYIVLLFVTVVTGVALAAYGWRHRHIPGAMAFAGVALGMSLWSFSLAMMAFTDAPPSSGRPGMQQKQPTGPRAPS